MTSPKPERDAIERIADRYRSEGFDVVVEPVGTDLPDGLRHVTPDVIARGPGGNVAVDVLTKGSRESGESVRRTAEAVEAEPDWRYELVVLPRRGIRRRLMADADAVARLDAAKATAGRDPAAAALLTWTAAEWALRHLVEAGDGTKLSPHRLVKEAYSADAVSEAQYRTLKRLAELRDAVVHGETERRPTPQFVDAALRLAGDLVERASRPAARAA